MCKTLKILFIALAGAMLAACAGQPVTAIPPSTPTDRPTPTPQPPCTSENWEVAGEINFGQPTISVMFDNPSFGIATDLGGGIHITEDGGKTWNLTADASNSRVALDIDNDTIWHIAFGGTFLRSTDRGKTWEHISQMPHGGHVEYVSFADEMNGWAVSTEQRTFFATTDGGSTWNKLPLPADFGRVASAQLRTSQEGYLLDTRGNLFISRDGGSTWETRTLSLPEGQVIPDQNHTAALRFLDEKNGLVALNTIGGGKATVYVLRTADGGATWSEGPLALTVGMFFLARDGKTLTYVDLLDHAKFTILCAPGSGK